ncbi:DUF551 domain-containing protein [Yersinia enterocolitica]|uniref:DUF551 domain-containing protein n=1 Tax=Yersinia enterocolitica TaxID=630 RepID=UPI001C66C0AB|nr:DUF551 domain-containing protein [Yersinia enterocolitica]MBW5861812.1 DUF551 domain-containing protein [Yersinia enterocolitica]
MKELDSFTVERLEQLINFTHESGIAYASRVEWQALARISLAAKRAEPVAYGTLQKEFCDEERSLFTDKDSASKYSESCYDLTPLYTTPQFNSPQGWINCSDHRPERGTDVQVYCSDTREQFVAFHIGNGEFQYAQHEDTSIACRPSHWMPLLAAPEKPL